MMSQREMLTQAKLAALMSYAPDHYGRSELYQQLMEADAVESVALREMLEDVFAQFFVETATWGLSYWEAELGLITNESLTYQMRRALVLQKLRGTGTMTAQTMASILSSYGARTVVIEQDYANYEFDAVLVDYILSPKRPEGDVHASIRETIAAVRPAHLGFLIQYREYVGESFRAWYREKTGREFVNSDQVLSTMTTQKEEMKFGQTEQNLFRLNQSTIGNTMFASSELRDDAVAVLERAHDQERYEMQGNETEAFRANQSLVSGPSRTLHVNLPSGSRWELVQTSSEQTTPVTEWYPGLQSDVVSWEIPFRARADAFRFSLSTQPAPLFPERLEEQAGVEQTQSVYENCPLQVSVLQAATTVGTLGLAEAMADVTAAGDCVLYRADSNGMETVLEQRAL